MVSIPIWMKLSDLNMHLWPSPQALATIAGAVGKPSFTEKLLTPSSGRLQFPRICVQVNGHSELPSDVLVEDEHSLYRASVENEWKSPRCKYCECLGIYNTWQ